MSWWILPVFITALALYWPFWINRSDNGLFYSVGVMLCMVPALGVISITWALAAIFK